MMKRDFTADDIDCLMDALEVWETKGETGELMADIFGSMLVKDDPIAKAKIEADRVERRQKHEREKRRRKERSIVLRAKLITMRDDAAFESMESAVSLGAVASSGGLS